MSRPDQDGAGPLSSPTWLFSYDAASHQLTGVTNTLNNTTQYQYGSHGRLTRITHPDTAYRRNVALQTVSLPTGTSGNSLTSGNPTGSVTDERFSQSTFRTDRYGNLTEWNNPLGHATTTLWNGQSQVIRQMEEDPDGGGPLPNLVTTNGYDASGNLVFGVTCRANLVEKLSTCSQATDPQTFSVVG